MENSSRSPNLFYPRFLDLMDIKPRNDVHLQRKLWHVLGILIIVYPMSLISQRESLFYLAIAGLIVIPFDILRLKRGDFNRLILKSFRRIIRTEEVQSLTGTSFLIAGAFTVALLFPKDIAVLSLLMLGFGDPASAIVGVTFGRDKLWGRKSLQGSLACFFTCSILCGVYFYTHNIMIDRLVLVSILGGVVGALSELAQFRLIDDNFSFPVFSAFGLWLMFAIFGGF